MSRFYPHLFSPLEVGGHELPNRLCLPATLTNFGAGNRVTERWSNFLVERAKGGTALLVSEIIAVDPNAIAHAAVVTGFEDENLPALTRTAAAVQAAGGFLVGQLWHPGRQQLWHPTRSPMGVSDQPDAYSWTVPHVMSAEDLARVAAAYVDVAVRLAACGFRGVELHGAHGYLITQLLSPWSNTRTDDYGVDMAGRAKFCRDVARAIKTRCGKDFVVGLKMPADEGVAGGIDVEEAGRITAHLAAAGCFDYFAYGQGNFSPSLENHVPDMHFRAGHFIDLHRAMRLSAAGVPVMALGRIGEPELAEKVVAEGYGDLVGMARALVSDAAFPNKARAGRREDIRPCVYNNTCWGEVHLGKPLAEFHNPHLGLAGEADWAPGKASRKRRITVVGAGPAGLEIAWQAAARGHRVKVLSRSESVGGKLALEAQLPGHGDLAKLVDYQCRLAERYGAEIELSHRANAASVMATDPEVVVLATGAQMRVWEGASERDTAGVVSVRELVRRYARGALNAGKRAVLFDHDHTAPTYSAVDVLASLFDEVTLLTPRTEIAKAVNYCSALGIHRRLHAAGVNIVVAAEPERFHSGNLNWRNVFSGREFVIEDVDLMVYATPRRVDDALANELRAALPNDIVLHQIGDCLSPRNLLIAVHEGYDLANRI